jgi:hypothetical protein
MCRRPALTPPTGGAVAKADRDAAIGQCRAQADQTISAAEATRDQARNAAGPAEQAARRAQQEATRAQAAEQAVLAETGRVHADADKVLAAFRPDAVRDRAERAERQVDAYRDELTQLCASTGPVTGTTSSSTTLPRARQANQP